MLRLLTPALIAALALPVLPGLAQEQTAAAAGPRPVLTLRSADPYPVSQIAREFGHRQALPALDTGEHYVLTVDPDRAVAVATATGAVRFLEVAVEPGALMELFADEIAKVKGIAQGVGVLAMTQQGMPAKEAAGLVAGIFDFPYLLERAEFVMRSDPSAMETDGLEIEVAVTAKPGNWLAGTVEALRPAASGCPVLPGSEGRMMAVQVSFDPEALGERCEPLMEFGLSMSYRDEAVRARARALWRRMMQLYDGGLAFAIGEGMCMEGLYGFRDGEELATFVQSPDYVELMRAQQPTAGNVEIELKEDVFEHRGAKFFELVIYNDGPANPMMPDDEMHQFAATLGSYMLMGGTPERAKAIADVVADGAVQREQLADGAVFAMSIGLREWFAALGQGRISAKAERMPARMSIQLTPKGRTLTAVVKAR
ncbi:MAG: hypothetical protein KDE27_11570 [Planctomycetes bacterium]|nr:hypothetical protein [Planctomycetota bacterium]